MSNKAKRIEQKTQFRFPLNMYTEMYGSLFIICHMFAEKRMTTKQLVKKWKNSTITIESEDWAKQVEEYLGYKIPYKYLGFVQSKFNALFCILDDEGQVLPLREDGWMPNTYRNGKVMRIV